MTRTQLLETVNAFYREDHDPESATTTAEIHARVGEVQISRTLVFDDPKALQAVLAREVLEEDLQHTLEEMHEHLASALHGGRCVEYRTGPVDEGAGYRVLRNHGKDVVLEAHPEDLMDWKAALYARAAYWDDERRAFEVRANAKLPVGRWRVTWEWAR